MFYLVDLMNDDGLAGMEWWNAMTEAERGHWLREAKSAVPADAWSAYKAWQEAQGTRSSPPPVRPQLG